VGSRAGGKNTSAPAGRSRSCRRPLGRLRKQISSDSFPTALGKPGCARLPTGQRQRHRDASVGYGSRRRGIGPPCRSKFRGTGHPRGLNRAVHAHHVIRTTIPDAHPECQEGQLLAGTSGSILPSAEARSGDGSGEGREERGRRLLGSARNHLLASLAWAREGHSGHGMGAQMKNFPHQMADFPKIRQALVLIAEMRGRGENVGDDEVLGYGLARRMIYQFRPNLAGGGADLRRRIEARIAQERQKPTSSQGARTAARELRRTLQFLGWLDDRFEVTETGRELLGTAVGSNQEQAALAAALLEGALDDGGAVSHPGRVLLRLVGERGPFASRDGMELAFEARDDSEGEFVRVLSLLGSMTRDRAAAMGASEYQMTNAVKILPSLMIQAGMIAQVAGGFIATPAGCLALGLAGPVDPGLGRLGGRRLRHALRPVPPGHRQVDRNSAGQGRDGQVPAGRPLSPEEQLEAVLLRVERTEGHQRLVRRIAQWGTPWDMFEGLLSYDLLMIPPVGDVVLWEAKTISGDAPTQVRLAAGQLLYYQHFHVEPSWAGKTVRRAAAFDADIGPELATFLDWLGIGAFVFEDRGPRALNDAAREIERLHG